MPFLNRNLCKSYQQSVTTARIKLSSQECSEMVAHFYSGTASDYIDIYDPISPYAYRLYPNQQYTIRGLTDTGVLSAQSNTNLTLVYRTQFFGSMTDL
jgi:hypothetical protein